MENKYVAKTENEKTIYEHTKDLLRQYEIIKKQYPNILQEKEWELLKDAILYHDLGKINTKFQNKLYLKLRYTQFLEDLFPNDEEIPHNFLSPLFLDATKLKEKYDETQIKILFSSIYYHHDRTMPFSIKPEEREQVLERVIEDLKKQLQNLGNFFDLPLKVKKYSMRYILSPNKLEDIKILKSKQYIMIQGLLNRIDHIASLDKEEVVIEESVLSEGKTIEEKTKEFLKGKEYRPAQQYMLEHQKENAIIIAPTGSGKTEAALLWAEKEKTFYTLPRKVTINAIFERIEKEIKYKNALLLHSDAYSYYYHNFKDKQLERYERSRKLSSPFIVTTVDQLFKIAFRYKGYEEILATLSYSKIIIDEIQMYSPKMVAYILIALKMITEVGGKFSIITATFPPMLYEFMDKLKITYLKQEKLFPAPIQYRHRIQVIEEEDFEIEKIRELAKHKKVLVLVNTVKKAQKLYKELQEENTYLLHSNFLKKDREKLENSALEFANSKENGILISTQIVEASLDIDFDVLFTDMCSIDSLFQRMGRVYRKREYIEEEPNVYIYNNRNGVPYIIESKIYDFSFNEIKKYNGKLLTEEDKQDMIENIFDKDKNQELQKSDYYQIIEKTIFEMENIIPNQNKKKEIDQEFRGINSITLIPDSIFEQLEAEGKIEDWEQRSKQKLSLEERMQLKEEISQYTVSIAWRYYLEYDQVPWLYDIHRTRYHYEFEEESLEGEGLKIEKLSKEGYFDE